MSPFSLVVLSLCMLEGYSAPFSLTSFVERTSQECNNAYGACFETIFFNAAGNKFSLGFAFPELGDESGSMIVNASLPLPYGFVSFTLGSSSTGNLKSDEVQPTPEMGMFVDEATERENNPPPLNLSDIRAQLSIRDGQGRLVPVRAGFANTFISPMSSRTSDSVDIIIRFQDSSLANMPIFTSESPQLSATFSLNPPQYLDSKEQEAELYLNGSIPISFTLNGNEARAGSFDAMIKVAGFSP